MTIRPLFTVHTLRPFNDLTCSLTYWISSKRTVPYTKTFNTFITSKNCVLNFTAVRYSLHECCETTYDVHLRLIGKRVVDFLLVWLFSLGVTAEAVRANIDWKLPFLKGVGSLWSKISGRREHPSRTICARLDRLRQWMPYNFAAESFHTKKLSSRLASREVHF